MAARDLALDHPLPDNIDAERFVLGAIMSSENAFLQVAGTLTEDDFSLEKHKRIFLRMSELHERGEKIDRVTLANELMKHGQLQSVDGLSYLVSLDDGLPQLHNLDSYVGIVKEKSLLRRIITVSHDTINRCLTGDEGAQNILGAVEDALLKLGDVQSKNALASPAQILTEYEGGINAFLDTSKRIKGIGTGFLKFDEMTGGMREGELIILAARPAMGKCIASRSKILLSDGTLQTVEEICKRREAELLTLDETGKLQVTSPSAFIDDGIKPVFRVTTRLGRTVETTLTHPFLTFERWRPLMDLQPGDTIAVPRSAPIFGTEKLPSERAKLLGYLIGDGCLTDGTPEFTNSNPRLRNEFIECLQSFEGVRFRVEDSDGSRVPTVCVSADREHVFEQRARFSAALADGLKATGRSDRSIARQLGISPSLLCQWKQARCVPVGETAAALCVALNISTDAMFPNGLEAASKNSKNALTRWLESLGLWGRSAAHKFIPEVVFTAERSSVALFLNRLFATDGWASVLSSGQAQLGFATVSERLARETQHLLLRFGIIAALKKRSVRYGSERRRAWQLDITHSESIRSFITEIGIFGKEKSVDQVAAALEAKTAHANRDLLPREAWRDIERAKGELSWAQVARLMGFGPGHNLHAGTRGVSRKRLGQLANALQSDHLRRLAASDIYWDRIVSIEYVGKQQVYDLTIPETHNFVADDVCVHNTALALNIAQHVATNPKSPKAVAVFSLEMSKESLLTRMLCAAARVDQQRFRAGYLNAEERHALQDAMYKMVEAPLFLDDTAGTNLMDVHSKLRRLQAEHDLGLVIIDYLQLMQGRGRFENRVQEISSLSRGFKLMSKELRVPFLVLSQLSRAPETRQGDHRPMLSDLRESGCLTGETLIPLPCSGKRVAIRDLLGDRQKFQVWSLNEKTLKLERAAVSNVFSTGVKPVFKLTTRLGRVIRATANHPFRVFSGWKRLDELSPGMHLALPRVVPGGASATMPEAELALLGHLIGEGCTLPRHVLQYTTREHELAELVSDLALDCFGSEVAPRIEAERSWFQVYLTSARAHTHGLRSAISDWLEELGVFGLRSWEKKIPDQVFRQPPELIGVFLRHLWATDGCINLRTTRHGKVPLLYYASSSETLARDVQSLLLRLEINARIRRVSQGLKGRDQFHVIVTGASDVRKAANRMGAVGERRTRKLQELMAWMEDRAANTNRDVVPAEVWREAVLPVMREKAISGRELASRLGMAYCGTQLYRQNLSRNRAERLGEVIESEEISCLATSDLYWDSIESVVPDGDEEVFDLTVPAHSNFIAADFVVHNSIEQDADLVGFIFREEVYRPDKESLKGIAELILAKQRNGPTGRVKLAYLNKFTKFENLAADTGDDDAPFE